MQNYDSCRKIFEGLIPFDGKKVGKLYTFNVGNNQKNLFSCSFDPKKKGKSEYFIVFDNMKGELRFGDFLIEKSGVSISKEIKISIHSFSCENPHFQSFMHSIYSLLVKMEGQKVWEAYTKC